MKPEILELIHLNTYVDYSANKATDKDINELQSKSRMEFDKDYLDFLRQLNGFKVYGLNILGTKTQDDLSVEDVLYHNDYASSENPKLLEYFIIGYGYGSKEWYVYHPKQKKYCSLQFTSEGVLGGKAFENLDVLLEWAVKYHAKRLNEKTKIIHKKTLLHVANQITSLLEANGFQTKSGNIILNSSYHYERITPLATEQLCISLQTNQLRNRLSLTIPVFKRYNLIETFFETEYMKKARIRDHRSFTIMLYEDLPKYQSKFSEQEWNDNYEVITAEIISFIKTHIFPAFKLYDDVRVLDSKVNKSLDSVGNLDRGNISLYLKMIIAKLAGNPMYDEIFKFAKERLEKGSKEFLTLAISLNDDLQKTSPLKDGLLV